MTTAAADPKAFIAQLVEATREAKRRPNWSSSQNSRLHLVRHDRTAELWGGEAAQDYFEAHRGEINQHALEAAKAKHEHVSLTVPTMGPRAKEAARKHFAAEFPSYVVEVNLSGIRVDWSALLQPGCAQAPSAVPTS